MKAKLDALQYALQVKFPNHSIERLDEGGMTDAVVLNVSRESLIDDMTLLRDDLELDFKIMIDLTGVHYPEQEEDVTIVYQLLSVYKNHRLRVKLTANMERPVPSVTGVWSSADWFERECWEMFGVRFTGHPDLRRLLTEYDFQDYPLRKEFPVTGKYEVFYDQNQGRVVRKATRLVDENKTRDDREFYANPANTEPARN